jgi:hypothetical protein
MKVEGRISLTVAARRAGKTPETIANWCRRYGIGKQLHPKAPWRVDPVALQYVIEGDADGLKAYLTRRDAA